MVDSYNLSGFLQPPGSLCPGGLYRNIKQRGAYNEMKKLTGLLFMLLICFLFAGCKGKKGMEIPSASGQTENTKNGGVESEVKEPVEQEKESPTPKEKKGENEKTPEVTKPAENIYKEDLSAEGETVLFSFRVSDTKKILSICMAEDQSYIVYRFGTADNIELEFPKDTADSFSSFHYSYYLRGGGPQNAGLDLNHLNFNNENYTYQVYDEYEAESGIRAVGVRVTDDETAKETDIAGDIDSVTGSMIPFRDMEDKITVIVE